MGFLITNWSLQFDFNPFDVANLKPDNRVSLFQMINRAVKLFIRSTTSSGKVVHTDMWRHVWNLTIITVFCIDFKPLYLRNGCKDLQTWYTVRMVITLCECGKMVMQKGYHLQSQNVGRISYKQHFRSFFHCTIANTLLQTAAPD